MRCGVESETRNSPLVDAVEVLKETEGHDDDMYGIGPVDYTLVEIRLLRGSDYIYTNDQNRMIRVAEAMEFGMIGVNTGNLVEDGTCSPALSGDPLLGNIGDYGGATETLPLLPGSRAIDAANADGCLPTDQRGVTRTPATCDIGAYEFQPWVVGQPVPRPPAAVLPATRRRRSQGSG